MHRRLLLGATLALISCSSGIPTSVLLTVEGLLPDPGQLRLTVYDDEGVALKDHLLVDTVDKQVTLPATVVLYPSRIRGPLRILIRSRDEVKVVGEGIKVVELKPAAQVEATLTIIEGTFPDSDKDGVPDDLDSCPQKPNPDQGPCGPTPSDAALDGGVDGPPVHWDSQPDSVVLPDAPRRDQPIPADTTPPPDSPPPPPDAPVPDTLSPDLVQPPDTWGYVPVSTGALSQAWQQVQVPCILSDGTPTGTQIPIIDTAQVTFVNGSVTLAGAPFPTVAWVGGKPSVSVIWDPNACDDEMPTDPTWTSACFLIRGATLNYQGELVLQPSVTIADINMLNCSDTGVFENEVFGPTDVGLQLYPHLVQPYTAAKQALLKAASP